MWKERVTAEIEDRGWACDVVTSEKDDRYVGLIWRNCVNSPPGAPDLSIGVIADSEAHIKTLFRDAEIGAADRGFDPVSNSFRERP